VSSALSAPSRRRLLALLHDSDAPCTASQLAQQAGLHVTTVRFHLDVLRQAGLVESRTQPRASIGRPRIVYSAGTRRRRADGPDARRSLRSSPHIWPTRPARARSVLSRSGRLGLVS